MSTTQLLDAEAAQKLAAFKDDLRAPKVVFGRCALTGNWGKCIALDFGDICMQTPDTERGVETGPDGKLKFTVWKPAVFANQITVSGPGLEMLLDFYNSQENPIPGLTPDLVYMWSVLYEDGRGLAQFCFNADGVLQEHTSADIDISRVNQMQIVSRKDPSLPPYIFLKETGKFYKDGKPLDTMYDGEYVQGAEIVYCRKVAHTWGSGMGSNGLDRDISNACTSVLQIFGWKVGGLQALVENQDTPGCLIAVDERGNWRPYAYN